MTTQNHTAVSLVLLLSALAVSLIVGSVFKSWWPDYSSLAGVVCFLAFIAAGLVYALLVTRVIFARCAKCGARMKVDIRRGQPVKYTCTNCGAVEITLGTR